ncbi:WcbI family polysaccharide biosynthesis putative acetyltransferase, partial [Acidisphaera rubrifaciens]|uniref:WcbI family polysaccharide biosynthesis putative acetyltransferase n=1 Tax=Acidisphaera rubrifaciens TaxID=50715 RepID=UPI00066241A0
MTTIAFYGTCQLACVEAVVRAHLARPHGLETFFVAAWTDLSDADRARIEAADVFVGQRLRFGSSADGLSPRGRVLLVPQLDNAFLWPFAGEAHPRNTVYPFHPYGPYPAEFGDRFLNRQIAEGVDPDVAVARYLALDVNAVVRLDRLREMSIEHQHHLDEATGFRMTPFVEAYQAAPLFRTVYHFELDLLHELAAQVVPRIGLGAAEAAVLRRLARQNPMVDVWLPIHPAVAEHFGLSYATAATRYRYFDEGSFTFAEYARRYMTYAWNRPLHEGAHLALAGRDAAA